MIPNELLYTKSHEWAKIEGDIATVGITHFAQEQLGDLTFVELPEVGRVLAAGEEMGSVESVKAASEIYSPVSGEVVEINSALDSDPALVNQDAYGQGWMIRIKLSAAPADLLSAEQYAEVAQGH